MVTKEKRARLRSMLENQVFEGELKEVEKLFAAIFEAPALLDALDEAEAEVVSLQGRLEHAEWWGHVDPAPLRARIVELETEQGELHRELARLRGQLATAREDASEMEKKAIAEGSEALALRAEVAALKAAAHYDAWLVSGDTGMSSKAIFDFMRTGTKGGWTPSDPSDLGRCLRLLERFPEWRERMPEMANCSPKWARMMPYWDALETSLLREVGGLHTDGSAPETFQMMKAIERGNGPLPTGDGQ